VEGNKYTREDKDISDSGDSNAGITFDNSGERGVWRELRRVMSDE